MNKLQQLGIALATTFFCLAKTGCSKSNDNNAPAPATATQESMSPTKSRVPKIVFGEGSPANVESEAKKQQHFAGMQNARCAVDIGLVAISVGPRDDLKKALTYYKAQAAMNLGDDAKDIYTKLFAEASARLQTNNDTEIVDLGNRTRACVNLALLLDK